MKRYLVPVDYSERSRAALRYAIELARPIGAQLDVLHVIPPVSRTRLRTDALFGRPLTRVPEEELEAARAKLRAFVAEVPHEGCELRTIVETGDPAATVVQLASEQPYALVVIATHGRRGLSEVLLGSVAHALLGTAPCPVLTLTPPSLR